MKSIAMLFSYLPVFFPGSWYFCIKGIVSLEAKLFNRTCLLPIYDIMGHFPGNKARVLFCSVIPFITAFSPGMNNELCSAGHCFEVLNPYDIIISEIMPDPVPAVLLPAWEYIELYNRTNRDILLENWTLEVGTKIYKLSGSMKPDSYLLITFRNAVELFKDYAETLGLFTSATALANPGQTLVLKDPNGEIIDAVSYTDKWYGDAFKAGGGWSLERIDLSRGCAGEENWTASISPAGGTPGSRNSVDAMLPGKVAPFTKGIKLTSGNSLEVLFSETITRSFFDLEEPFRLLNSTVNIVSVQPFLPFYDGCRIELSDSITDGIIYVMSIDIAFMDCSGNKPDMPLTVRFGKPVKPGFTDIILTEVLYNPFPGCPEFIEIYSNSEWLLDLSGLVIGLNYEDGQPVRREYITNDTHLFFPGDYLVLSRNPKQIENYYDVLFPANLFEVRSLPALRNTGGCIELTDRSFQMIDRYCYSKSEQYPLLNSDQGVSLERMNIDRRPGYESFWHSASSVYGFATPGYKNSQSLQYISGTDLLEIVPGTFSPNNDGVDDVAMISCHLNSEGYTGNIVIFDATGRQVRYLVRNELLGFENSFVWDGRNDAGLLCRTGIYLVFFDAFNLRGERVQRKKTVVLVRR